MATKEPCFSQGEALLQPWYNFLKNVTNTSSQNWKNKKRKIKRKKNNNISLLPNLSHIVRWNRRVQRLLKPATCNSNKAPARTLVQSILSGWSHYEWFHTELTFDHTHLLTSLKQLTLWSIFESLDSSLNKLLLNSGVEWHVSSIDYCVMWQDILFFLILNWI